MPTDRQNICTISGTPIQLRCQNFDRKLENSSFCTCAVQIWLKNTDKCSSIADYPLQCCWIFRLVHYRPRNQNPKRTARRAGVAFKLQCIANATLVLWERPRPNRKTQTILCVSRAVRDIDLWPFDRKIHYQLHLSWIKFEAYIRPWPSVIEFELQITRETDEQIDGEIQQQVMLQTVCLSNLLSV